MTAWSCASCTFLNDNEALAQCAVCNAIRVVSCAKCRQDIKFGPRLRVHGATYHPDCFNCTACHKTFPTNKFSVKDGKPYHSECLPKEPVILCAKCFEELGNGPRLTVSGQLYHPNCFVCKPFPTHQFMIKDGDAYHPNCLPSQAAAVVTCAKCQGDIGFGPRLTVSGSTYHTGCFRCAGCHEPFGAQQFQIKDNEPYHKECFKLLYNPRCEVCDNYIPFKPDGKSIAYKEVPFWNMRYCPAHDDRDRCCSCQRIEPLAANKKFDVLSDGRKVCHDCSMLVVLDTIEVKGVVAEVWEFMESIGIRLPKLPVYLVESQVLNEHCHTLNRKSHDHSSNKPVIGHVTRGLCLSEITQVKHMMRRGRSCGPEVVSVEKNRSVNAILILHGLPYDLTAQVLAHEATHSFIKLSDDFPDHLPMMVEEGMCQLMSYLYLKYKQLIEEDETNPKMKASFPARLRQFLVMQIENDQTPVYGDGFRAAFEAYNRVHSLQKMFDSLRRTGQFPNQDLALYVHSTTNLEFEIA
uniref:LIM zinc-binding domain-containing protein n=1 Tax=Globisporangium ultimum (strain ATCC 200006 / CBS 805.95 / DAOM BR144) TaxID=431595 RepID=K3WFM1_GLOUD